MKKLVLILLSSVFLFPSFSWSQGCVEPTSEEGIQLIGFIQAEGSYQFLGKDAQNKLLDESSFYFNRARLGVTGNIPYDFSYYFMSEFSPRLGGPFILDAFVSYNRFAPYLKVAVGQFKSPFGLELLTPCHKLHTINRAMAVNQLVDPFRDQGIMLSGSTGELKIFGLQTKNLIGYNFAVMNGTGRGLSEDGKFGDNNNKKDIIGRLTIHPVEFLTVGASYRFGKQPAKSATATTDDEKKRLGIDVELKYKNLLLQGEFVDGTDKGSYTVGGGCSGDVEVREGSIKRNGYFVQALYMTPWKIQPVVRLESYDPNLDVSTSDLTQTSTDYIQNTIVYGFNYFFNDKVRFQFNYLYNAEENGLVEKKNDTVLAQLQVSF